MASIIKAINTLIESGKYGWFNVFKKAQKNRPLTASRIGWIVREAPKISKANKVTKILANAVA